MPTETDPPLNSVKTSIYIPRGIYEQLSNIASAEERALAEVIRDAFRTYLKETQL